MLHFTLAVRGDLRPRVSESGRDVTFTTAAGDAALTYNNLKVFDADGVHLAASLEAVTSSNCTPTLRLTIDDTHARYPLTIDPIAQQAYLKASNTASADFFGISLAVSGELVVVGAIGEDSNATGVNGNQADNNAPSSGAAYVFARSGSTWTQQAYLKASNTGGGSPAPGDTGDSFGAAVAISGDTIVVGAPDERSNAMGVNGNEADNSAFRSGAAYVFVRAPGSMTWVQQAYIKASNTGGTDGILPGDQFGSSVAISGETIIVGAYLEDSSSTGVNGNQADGTLDSGAAYVFVRSGTVWTQQAYLKASNTDAFDYFGVAVAISGDTVVVGAIGEASNATGINGNDADDSSVDAGAAFVFVRTGTLWTQQAYLKASNSGPRDSFARVVAISGDTVVVGAALEDSNATGVNGNQANNSASDSGAAYVFLRVGSTWTQQAYLKASNAAAIDHFGSAVAVAGDRIVVGADLEDSNATGVNGNQANNSLFAAGAAYLFVRSGTNWTQQAYFKASNPGSEDNFGASVAISGDTVVVGALREDSNATGVNGNQLSNNATNSGAAYVFLLPPTTPASPLASPATVCTSGSSAALSVNNPSPGIVIDWFTGSCGGTLIGTGNPLNVTPAATTTYFARARRTSDGNTSDACVQVAVTVALCSCNPADIANTDGDPAPDNAIDNGDFGLFFQSFFLPSNDPARLIADIANTDGETTLTGGGPDGAIDNGDFNAFFALFFQGCPTP